MLHRILLLASISLALTGTLLIGHSIASADGKKVSHEDIHFTKEVNTSTPNLSLTIDGNLHILSEVTLNAGGLATRIDLHTNLSDSSAVGSNGGHYEVTGATSDSISLSPPVALGTFGQDWTVVYKAEQKPGQKTEGGYDLKCGKNCVALTLHTTYNPDGTLAGATLECDEECGPQ